MHIGDKIRKVRELKGYKQEYVADKLGMSVTAYGNIERGDSSLSFDRLEEIAAVMEVAVQDILNIPEQLNIHSIEAVVNPENNASIKILEKNGFVREAYYVEDYYFEGKFLDSAVYSLLEKNFIQKKW